MNKFIELIEQFDFSVNNSDNYESIEIRDLLNNNKMLARNNNLFIGSNDRNIQLSENGVIIKVNKNLEVRQVEDEEDTYFYIDSTLPDYSKNEIVIANHISKNYSEVGYLETSFYHGEKTKSLYINQKPTKAKLEVWGQKDYVKEVAIDECNTDFYIQNIVNFLSHTKANNDENLKRGINGIIPSLTSSLDEMFNNFYNNIENYISYYEDLEDVSSEQEVKILKDMIAQNVKK